MSYQSPIELIMGQLQTSFEDQIVSAVQQVGINVDKEELIKALQYDRYQYQKGYTDRDSEIVRCKDCKNAEPAFDGKISRCKIRGLRKNDWFCADGAVKWDA